jgi:hypothetical protein
MKGSAAGLDWIAKTVKITAMGAACTVHLILSTSVCRKILKTNTAKGFQTSSQVVAIEEQPCMKG